MLRKIGEKLGLNRCPVHVLADMGDGLIKILRGKVSQEVLDLIDKVLPRFAPEKGDTRNFREDLLEHLDVNYVQKKGDVEIMRMWLRSLGENIDRTKVFHEALLGRDDMDRRSKYPDIWSADNICHGLKTMPYQLEPGIISIYGRELVKVLPMRLARNLSLLFEALNEWAAGTKDVLLNSIFQGATDDLEKKKPQFELGEVSDIQEAHRDFHGWVISQTADVLAQRSTELGKDLEKLILYDKVNFFIGSSSVNVVPFKELEGIVKSARAGLDSALSIYVMLLLKISEQVPGNPDGSMSPEQKKVWTKTLVNFVKPSAQGSHAWAGHFFGATNTTIRDGRGKGQPSIGQRSLDAMTLVGTGDTRYVDIHPETHATLKLQMIKLGFRRNGCPALKVSNGKAPVIFRLAEMVRSWHDEGRVQNITKIAS